MAKGLWMPALQILLPSIIPDLENHRLSDQEIKFPDMEVYEHEKNVKALVIIYFACNDSVNRFQRSGLCKW